MSYLIVDTETAISNKGTPYDESNELCYIGWKTEDTDVQLMDYIDDQYGHPGYHILRPIYHDSLVVGCNLKFDLAWLRMYGYGTPKRVFDIALAFFILRNQRHVMPSLNQMAEYYGLERKIGLS